MLNRSQNNKKEKIKNAPISAVALGFSGAASCGEQSGVGERRNSTRYRELYSHLFVLSFLQDVGSFVFAVSKCELARLQVSQTFLPMQVLAQAEWFGTL